MNKFSEFVRRSDGRANQPAAEHSQVTEPFEELNDHTCGSRKKSCTVNMRREIGHGENRRAESLVTLMPIPHKPVAPASYRSTNHSSNVSCKTCAFKQIGASTVFHSEQKMPGARELLGTMSSSPLRATDLLFKRKDR